jgi:hypothetical protein
MSEYIFLNKKLSTDTTSELTILDLSERVEGRNTTGTNTF